MALRKNTEMLRRTVTQVARVILGPEEGAAPSSVRRVTVLTPENPTVFLELDVLPEDLGGDRTYEMSRIPADERVPFLLAPGQFLVGAAEQGLAQVTLIVEYVHEEHL